MPTFRSSSRCWHSLASDLRAVRQSAVRPNDERSCWAGVSRCGGCGGGAVWMTDRALAAIEFLSVERVELENEEEVDERAE